MGEFELNYRYNNWYSSENYDRVTLILPKGSKARIKAEADKQHLTMTEYIKQMMPEGLIAEREYVGKRDMK